MPEHCGVLFGGGAAHSVTAVGYGEDTDGFAFWKIRNSWGSDWGEGGNIRFARGLGHCGLATQYAVPECRR